MKARIPTLLTIKGPALYGLWRLVESNLYIIYSVSPKLQPAEEKSYFAFLSPICAIIGFETIHCITSLYSTLHSIILCRISSVGNAESRLTRISPLNVADGHNRGMLLSNRNSVHIFLSVSKSYFLKFVLTKCRSNLMPHTALNFDIVYMNISDRNEFQLVDWGR